MISKPQFKPHFHVEMIEGEGVLLISEVGHVALTGRLFELVAPLIDGQRSSNEIVEALRKSISPAEVYYALDRLEQCGYLAEGDGSLSIGEGAFWSIQDVAPVTAMRRLAETAITVTVLGNLTVEPFRTLLHSAHVRVGESGDLGVVLTDDYLRTELHQYNLDALRSGRPWMLVKPVGAQILIGPVFAPGQTGCWNCLAQRLRMNRAVETFVQRKTRRDGRLPIPRVTTPALQEIAGAMAATEIAKWIARGSAARSSGEVLSLDVLTWKMERHALTRQPLCTACGDAASAADDGLAKPIVLESRKKRFTDDGGHRIVAPEETLRKYEHHVSPVTGAVKALQRHLLADNGVMHVYVAGENYAAQHYSLSHLKQTLRSPSAGKGISDLQAKASGLCEALERYSGVFQGTELRRRAKLHELQGLGMHPNECMGFSDRQYDDRERINALGLRFHYVPVRFDEDADAEWTPVWSLTHKIHRYLPTSYCYTGYPMHEHQRYCIPCSNGNAAGNTLEEAILQGFFELVERDSVALWWYNRVRRPAVDLDSFDEPYLGKVRAFLTHRGRELWVLDLTSDLGIPVCAAVSRRAGDPREHVIVGFGAHLDPRIALLRSITELNQMLVWLFTGGKNGQESCDGFEESDLTVWLKTATLQNQPYLAPDADATPRDARSYERRSTDDLRDDVLLCQQLVERNGMEMLVLEQTRPDIGLPVAKVFVPGLRHFWPRFAPGRLYDVPVSEGWLAQATDEAALNPVSMFI